MKLTNTDVWWGPPKKFSTKKENRKISWLELFYDLVYVIAISKITHHFAENLNFSGLLDYTYLFTLIFWGWFNGSLFHDLHGTTGLRTNLMTLWQMMIVAALIVVFSFPDKIRLFDATIVIIIMQSFVTYLWWSVGIYDKEHRKLSRPYTICFLIALGFIILSLFVHQPYLRITFYLSLFFNYIPPFGLNRKMVKREFDFSLSSNMTERFGTLTMILFGEVATGLVSGVSALNGKMNFQDWVNFAVAILIVFALWWIFFSMLADRESKKGWAKSHLMAYSYIPTLMALGAIGVGFGGIFQDFSKVSASNIYGIKVTFCLGLSTFLTGVFAISELLDHPREYLKTKRKLQRTLLFASLFFVILAFSNLKTGLFAFLLIVFLILLFVIIVISKKRLVIELNKLKEENLTK